jgi:putative heme iron utilization protein
MSEIFTSEISDRICKHMNEDHADAILLYAKAFGNTESATSATMIKIDEQGMDLDVQDHDSETSVRITFDHELKDAEDAHQTLIAMVKQARQQLK